MLIIAGNRLMLPTSPTAQNLMKRSHKKFIYDAISKQAIRRHISTAVVGWVLL